MKNEYFNKYNESTKAEMKVPYGRTKENSQKYRWIIYNMYHVSELFRPEKIAEVEMSFKMDWKFMIVASVIFLMSYIFKYGAELQKLSDETL